jgi:hypothetical protein
MYVGKIRLKNYSAMMVFSRESVSPEGWFTVVYVSWDTYWIYANVQYFRVYIFFCK